MNMGVKDVREYANKRVQKQPFSDTNPFIDAAGNPFTRGDDGEAVNALDPRLVYRKRVQSSLLLKMLRRGEIIPPNTRLEMVVLHDPSKEGRQPAGSAGGASAPNAPRGDIGDRAEEYSNYKENRAITKARLDYLYYIEHQLENPVTEILVLKYPTTSYLPPQKRYEEAFAKLPNVARTDIPTKRVYTYTIGKAKDTTRPPHTYMSRGLEAQVTYAIRESKSLKLPEDFRSVCLTLKSHLVLKRLFKQHHLRAPAQRTFMGARNLIIREIVAARAAFAAVVAEIPTKRRKKRRV